MDVLKVIAAIIIVFHHYQQVFSVSFSGINFIDGSFSFYTMVELFFIISGFVMVIGDNPKDRHIGKSFLKKCVRLYPSVALSVTVILLIQLLHLVLHGECTFWGAYSPLNIISSYLLIFRGFGINVGLGVNNPTWYLCILLQCFLIFYTVKLLFGENEHGKFIAYFIIALLSGLQKNYNLFHHPFSFISGYNLRGFSCFFIGALIAVYQKNVRDKRFGTLFGILAVLLWTALQVTRRINLNNWAALVFLYSGIVLCLTSIQQIPHRMIQKIEGLPFEMFLWHMPVFYLIEFITETAKIEIRHSYLSMVAVTLFVECLAYFVYTYFEVPVGKWLRNKLA